MKKFLLTILLSFFFFCGSAYAITQTPFDMYTPYGTNFNILGDSITQLDFASSYGVAVNANVLAVTPPDDPFNFVFQSNITGFTDIKGNSAATPGINLPAGIPGINQYEYTLIGSIWESYDGLGGLGASFTLANAPAGETNYIEIYADTYNAGTTQSNLNTGAGFTDGTLILKAEAVSGSGLFSVDDTNSNGALDNQDEGIGSTKVIWEVSFFDAAYFNFGGIDLSDPTNYLYSQFDGTLNLPPPADANSIVMFDGTDPDFFTGLADGTTPYNTNDFLFQVDGFKIFQPGIVPEPGTFFLFGLGLLGLSATARRKK